MGEGKTEQDRPEFVRSAAARSLAPRRAPPPGMERESGRSLMVERVGAWDLARLTRLVDESPEQVVRAHILVQEASFVMVNV